MLAALAWRNLWRRPQRTILSLVSIALVTALLVFMLSFQDGVYGAMKSATLRIFDGYAQFQPQGWADDPTLERAIEQPRALARQASPRRRGSTPSPSSRTASEATARPSSAWTPTTNDGFRR
jgi:ABC-type lipoprotein release transport system permease subunit